jgi:hypothetical protein
MLEKSALVVADNGENWSSIIAEDYTATAFKIKKFCSTAVFGC